MDRRQLLFSVASGLAASALPRLVSSADTARPIKTRLGIDEFSYNIRSRAERAGQAPTVVNDPLTFLKHCHSIGAGGLQCGIGNRDKSYIDQLRMYAETNNLFIEDAASLPRSKADVERFQMRVRTAKQAGARTIRVALGGRRYEQFDRAEQFKAFAERSWQSIQMAEPVVSKHRIPLAIENHKDWRIPELLEMLKRLESEYVGVCLDTGNSFALLEDPMEVVQAYAPWTHAVHLKDMAVCEYEDGFLLADVVFGEGTLDLPKIVQTIRKAKPGITFSAEMSTRDPLRVPCLTEKYWATFASISGSDLAGALRYVRANASPRELLPKVSNLPLEQQIKLEEDNVKKCLIFAMEHLNL
jgi:sugar phosphate isomerase/epimerase